MPKRRSTSTSSTTVRKAGESWVLVPPRCANEREDDLSEVQQMLAMGEADVARDELRWLLEDCPEMIDAHRLLGEIALAEEDSPLARGHFGHAFRIGVAACRGRVAPGGLLYREAANRPFFESGKGLVYCLLQLGKRELAGEVVETLLGFDPSDPLKVKAFFDGANDAET